MELNFGMVFLLQEKEYLRSISIMRPKGKKRLFLSLIHIFPDEEQTKELKATVDYVLGDEVQTEDHKDLTATVQILQPDTLSTQGVEAKEYKGWKLEKITINDKIVQNLPATVNNGDAVRYHYIIDEDQTKELKATVDYKLGAKVQSQDHKDCLLYTSRCV